MNAPEMEPSGRTPEAFARAIKNDVDKAREALRDLFERLDLSELRLDDVEPLLEALHAVRDIWYSADDLESGVNPPGTMRLVRPVGTISDRIDRTGSRKPRKRGGHGR